MKKCPIFVYRAFFQNPIWGIFSLKMGHFFRSEGLATVLPSLSKAKSPLHTCFSLGYDGKWNDLVISKVCGGGREQNWCENEVADFEIPLYVIYFEKKMQFWSAFCTFKSFFLDLYSCCHFILSGGEEEGQNWCENEVADFERSLYVIYFEKKLLCLSAFCTFKSFFLDMHSGCYFLLSSNPSIFACFLPKCSCRNRFAQAVAT